MKIADGYAHRRMNVTVLATALDSRHRTLVYVRRAENVSPFAGYLFDLFVRDVDGVWKRHAATKTLVSRLCGTPVGDQFSHRQQTFTVIAPAYAAIEPIIVVEPPEDGWLWQSSAANGRLTEQEADNVRFNFGLGPGASIDHLVPPTATANDALARSDECEW